LAEEYGAEIIRVFPGNAVGGPDFIKAILQPRPWSKLMPSGGIGVDRDNLTAWFRAGAAMVGMGSALTPNMWGRSRRLRLDHQRGRANTGRISAACGARPGMLGGAAATSTGTVPVVKPTGS
jgi:2-keto-3-deoxy-phosphogluconate aldolase (EC 4.1.2.14)